MSKQKSKSKRNSKSKYGNSKYGLTPKQEMFCHEYIIDQNATQAAIRAGYSKKSAKIIGAQNLTKLNLLARVEELMEEHQKNNPDLVATEEEVLKYLTSVMRGESVSEEIVVESVGIGISVANKVKKAPSEKDRIAAADKLLKCYGGYADKQKQKLDGERFKLEKERLEMEKKKTEAAAPDKEIKVFVGDYEPEWSE